jgi:hypothetical protein
MRAPSANATVTSTAGDAALSVSDPSAQAPGHLVNGGFSLAQPLTVKATDAGSPGGAFAALGAEPLTALSWSGPVTGDAVTLGYEQQIGASEALRTGGYGKTLIYTLSTTTP